ncbi:MAG: hypothetical protein QM500_15020 [Methylococcales bacterium]
MKNLIITSLMLIISFPVFAINGGCLKDGKLEPFGKLVAIDKNNPQTLQWHQEVKAKYGVLPDGGAYKFMVCSIRVNPLSNDVPDISKREYVWVLVTDGVMDYEKPPLSYSDTAKELAR